MARHNRDQDFDNVDIGLQLQNSPDNILDEIAKLRHPSSSKKELAVLASALVMGPITNWSSLSRVREGTGYLNKYLMNPVFGFSVPYQVEATAFMLPNIAIMIRSFIILFKALGDDINMFKSYRLYKKWLKNPKTFFLVKSMLTLTALTASAFAATSILAQNKPPAGETQTGFQAFSDYAAAITSSPLTFRGIAAALNCSPEFILWLSGNLDYRMRQVSLRRHFIREISLAAPEIMTSSNQIPDLDAEMERIFTAHASGENYFWTPLLFMMILGLDATFFVKAYVDANYKNAAEQALAGDGLLDQIGGWGSYIAMLFVLSFAAPKLFQQLLDIADSLITKRNRVFCASDLTVSGSLVNAGCMGIGALSSIAALDRFAEFAPLPIISSGTFGQVVAKILPVVIILNGGDLIATKDFGKEKAGLLFLTEGTKKTIGYYSPRHHKNLVGWSEKLLLGPTHRHFLNYFIRFMATNDAFLLKIATPVMRRPNIIELNEADGLLNEDRSLTVPAHHSTSWAGLAAGFWRSKRTGNEDLQFTLTDEVKPVFALIKLLKNAEGNTPAEKAAARETMYQNWLNNRITLLAHNPSHHELLGNKQVDYNRNAQDNSCLPCFR